jgi:hypothetical protein
MRGTAALAIVGLSAAALTAWPSAEAPQPRTSALHVVEIVNDGQARGEIALTIDLPRGLPGDALQLRDEDGDVAPLQVALDRRASFILAGLAPGERRRLTIEPALDRRPRPVVEATRRPDRVDITIDQRQTVVYRGDESLGPPLDPAVKPILRRGGYLHPVLTPQGRVVTDDYPPNHLHHHGIWSAWADSRVAGRAVDFWNMGEGTGAVQFETLIDTWSGPVHGGVRARHRFVDLGTSPPTTALTEEWHVTVYAVGRGRPAYRVLDVVSRQDAATRDPVELAQYLYGGIGVRGNRAWNGATAMQFLTSEGRTRTDGHGTRARWCYMGGLVGAGSGGGRSTGGIVIFDHPQNLRHPQPMRLHPNEPFFSYAPVQIGAFAIQPGQPYVARYRFVTIDTPPDPALFERLWRDFAHPPGVTLQ